MKKLIFLLVCLPTLLFAQAPKTVADIFTADELVFYGVDFSKAKLVGPSAFQDPTLMRDIYYLKINDLIATERDKFDINSAFRVRTVIYRLDIVNKRNLTVNSDSLVDYNHPKKMSEADLQKIISSYDINPEEGIGLVFIVESLSKFDEKGYMNVVLFDLSNKTILLTDRISGEAIGFGPRNHWGNTVLGVLKKIYSGRYRLWKNEFTMKN